MTLCEMKGLLSFNLLWLIHKKPRTGSEIADELERRKGCRPSPGTIYPPLKDLKTKGLISVDKKKRYTITKKGKEELDILIRHFFETFCDLDEMKKGCR